MVKASSNSTPVISRLEIRNAQAGGVLITPDDLLIDTEYYFVRKDPSVDQTFYNRSLGFSYEHSHPEGRPRLYNKEEADQVYAGMGISKAPYSLKDKFSSLSKTEMDKIVWATIHRGPEIEWRWPEPGERV